LELGAPELGNFETNVEIEWEGRVPVGDSDPIMFARLFCLRDDTKALDHFRWGPLLVKDFFENSCMMHNVS
jgi:hypothetical protein